MRSRRVSKAETVAEEQAEQAEPREGRWQGRRSAAGTEKEGNTAQHAVAWRRPRPRPAEVRDGDHLGGRRPDYRSKELETS